MLDDTQSIVEALKQLVASNDKNAIKMQKLLAKGGFFAAQQSMQEYNKKIVDLTKSINKLADPKSREQRAANVEHTKLTDAERMSMDKLNKAFLTLTRDITQTGKNTRSALQTAHDELKHAFNSVSNSLDDVESRINKSKLPKTVEDIAKKMNAVEQKFNKAQSDLSSLPAGAERDKAKRTYTRSVKQWRQLEGQLDDVAARDALRARRNTIGESLQSAANGVEMEANYNRKKQFLNLFGLTPEQFQQRKDELVGFAKTPFGVFLAVMGVAIKLMGTFFDLVKATGTGFVQLTTLAKSFGTNYFAALRQGIVLLPGQAAEIQAALVEQFGRLDIGKDLFKDTAQLANYGVAANDAALLVRQLDLVVGGSAKLRKNTLDYIASLSKVNNIPLRRIYQDLARNSEMVARAGERNAQSLVRAAAAAAKMGIDLSSIERTADALTDYEGSIQSEAQLKSLTGRFDIDLSRARQFAFANDYDSLQKELSRQLGGAEGLRSLAGNRAQQNALQQTLGLSLAEIQRLARGESIAEGNGQGPSGAENFGQSILNMVGQLNFTAVALTALAAAASLASFSFGGGAGLIGKVRGLFGGGAAVAGGTAAAGAAGGGGLLSGAAGLLGTIGTGIAGAGALYQGGRGIYDISKGQGQQGWGRLIGTGLGGLAGAGLGSLIGNPILGGLVGANIGGWLGNSVGDQLAARSQRRGAMGLDTATSEYTDRAAPESEASHFQELLLREIRNLTNALISGHISVNMDSKRVGLILAEAGRSSRVTGATYVKPVA